MKNIKRERDEVCKVYLVLALFLFCSIKIETCLMMVSVVMTGFKPLS